MNATTSFPTEYDQRTVTGLVLAGGMGRRMGGEDKGLVTLAGRPMVAHVLDVLRPQVGPLLGLFFGDADVVGGEQPVDFATAGASVALGRYPAFFHGMLERGIALAPGPWEVWFPSLAHSEDDVRITLEVAHEVVTNLPG